MTALEWLIHPMTAEEFYQRLWDRSPHHFHQPGRDFGDVLRLQDLDTIIATTLPPPWEIHAMRCAAPVSVDIGYPAHRSDRQGQPDINRLYSAVHEGFSVTVKHVEQRWAAVGRLCARLQEELSHRVGANLYFSPANAQALPIHYDTHDVMVLQVHGQKTFRVYSPQVTLPLEGQPRPVDAEEQRTPLLEASLSAGDVLYMPRGFLHHALTGEHSSLHVTLGIYVTRWADLIGAALERVAVADVRFREAVRLAPPGDVQSHLRNLLASFADSAVAADAIRLLTDRRISQSVPCPDGHFAQIDRLSEVDVDTRVVKRDGMSAVVDCTGERVTIAFPGNVVGAPLEAESTFRHIAQVNHPFRVSDLPPGPLDDGSNLVLVKRLIREGLLRTAP